MPVWRCPHCGTPQVESSRCWVCRRSTTSCAACRHFRRAIAAGLGVCGIDPRRPALRGSEMRGCWEAADTTGASGPLSVPVMALGATGARHGRTFVPVGGPEPADDNRYRGVAVMASVSSATGAGEGSASDGRPSTGRTSEGRSGTTPTWPRRIPGAWSLWGDLEG